MDPEYHRAPRRKRTTKGSSMWITNYEGRYDHSTIQGLASDHSRRHSGTTRNAHPTIQQGIHSYFYPLRTEMLQWEDQDLLEQLLMPTHMTWIRGVDPWIILKTYEELTEKAVRDENDTLVCDQCDKDGNPCQFSGTPVSMG